MTPDNAAYSRLLRAQAKAEVLTEALPWIKTFTGATVVIKYGGNAMTTPELQQSFADDIAFLRFAGLRPIVVHGGGPQITQMLDRLDIPHEFIGGQRYTTEEAAQVIRMVLAGSVNRDIVARINMNGNAAVGLSGEDADLLLAQPATTVVDGTEHSLGRVGDITSVNTDILHELLSAGRVPVICSIAAEDGGVAGQPLNINADYAAASIAAAMGAHKLLILTDVAGLYANWPDTTSLISQIDPAELRAMLPRLSSGMVPKMSAALYASEHGVEQVHIVDGRMAHSVLLEIFTTEGIGTLVQEASAAYSPAEHPSNTIGEEA